MDDSKPRFEPVDDWVDVHIRDLDGIEGHFAPVFTREVNDSEKEELEDGSQVDVDVTMLYGNLDIYDFESTTLTRTSIAGIQPEGLKFGQDAWGKYFCRIDLGDDASQDPTVEKLRQLFEMLYTALEATVRDTVRGENKEHTAYTLAVNRPIKEGRYFYVSVSQNFWKQNIVNQQLKGIDSLGRHRPIVIFPTMTWARIVHGTTKNEARCGIKWHLGFRTKRQVPSTSKMIELETNGSSEEDGEAEDIAPPKKKLKRAEEMNPTAKKAPRKKLLGNKK